MNKVKFLNVSQTKINTIIHKFILILIYKNELGCTK